MADDFILRAIERERARQAGGAAPPTPAAPAAPTGSFEGLIARKLGQDIGAPPVPQQRTPQPAEAERRLLESAVENYSLSTPGPEASQRAAHLAQRIRAQPAPVPADLSLAEQAVLAYAPQRVRRDSRPESFAEETRSLTEPVKDILNPLGPAKAGMVIAGAVGPAMAGAVGLDFEVPEFARDIMRPSEHEGLPTEPGVLWAMRTIAGTIPAFAQETIERIPLPDLEASLAARTWAETAEKFFTPSSVAEQLGGYEAGSLQRIHREGYVADWAQGILERVEGGRGLEEDFALAAERRLGPEWKNTGWWVGLAADTLTNWEGAFIKGSTLVPRLAGRASELQKLDPTMKVGPALWTALRNNEVEMGEWLGGKLVRALENGEISIDDLPADIRARAEEVSLREYGRPLYELADIEGIGRSKVAEVEDLAYQQALDAAKAGSGQPGPQPKTPPPAPTPTATPSPATPPPPVDLTPLKAQAAAARVRAEELAKQEAAAKPSRAVEGMIERLAKLEERATEAKNEAGRLRAEINASPPRAPEPAPTPTPTPTPPDPKTDKALRKAKLEAERAQVALRTYDAALARLLEPEQVQQRKLKAQATGADPDDLLAEARKGVEFSRNLDEQQLAKATKRIAQLERKLAPPAPKAKKPAGPDPRIAKAEAAESRAAKLDEDRKALEAKIDAAMPRVEAPADGALAAAQAELKAAEAALAAAARTPTGTPGVDPGAFGPRRQVTPHPERSDLAKPSEDRPRLPDFEKPTAQAVWEHIGKLNAKPDRPPKGYSIGRHDGFFRLTNHTELDIDRPDYLLRNMRGDVVGHGTFDEVVELAMRRGTDGDRVWDGLRREVARWSKTAREGTEDIKWVADYHFSSPVERRILDNLREIDPRAKPVALKRRIDAPGKVKGGEAAAQVAGRVLADTLTDAPPGRAPGSRMGQLIADATRLAVRDKMGDHRLRPLSTGALVSRQDHARILKGASEQIGISQKRAGEIIGGAKPTDLEEARLAALAKRYGVDREPGQLTTRDWLELRNGAIREVGGVLADARYRLRGTQPLVDQMFGALQDAHLDRRKWGRITERFMKFGPVTWLSKALLEDKLARLPPQVRTNLRRLRTRLQRSADDLKLEFEAVKGESTTAGKLLDVVKRWTPVHPDELALARQEPDPLVIRAEWRGKRPKWLDSDDPLIFAHGVKGWSRRTVEGAADQGRRWVASHLAAGGEDVSGTLLAETVKRLPVDVAVRVYEEALTQGILDGPALREALRMVDVPNLKTDVTGALVTHALQTRADAIIAEEMDELIAGGFTVRQADPRVHGPDGRSALNAALHDEHRTWNEAAQRWEYRYPEAQVTFALERLRDWGIDPGSAAALDPTTLGRKQVVLPKYISDELGRMVASAQVDSRGIYDHEFLNTLTRYFKEWTTHGVILPNPAYFTGQMVSLVPTLYTALGATGAARVGLTMLRHPLLVGSLVKRLAGGGSPTFASRVPEGDLLRTADGGLVSVDDLEQAARRHGLQDTPASFETAERLKDVIARDGADYAMLDPRRLLMPARWWQNTIRTVAGSFDLTARMSSFVTDVERGIPLDVAAQNARASTLDFRDLTLWEATHMRKVFTFYAFMRKNADAYIKALFHHPERVLSQMRLAHASATGAGLTPIELGAMRDDDIGRLTVYDDDEVVNDQGRVHPLYRFNRLQTTPLGVAEWMGIMRMFSGGDMPKLLQSMSPLVQTFAVIAQGRKLDREFDSPHANRIPPVLMDSPMAPLLHRLFGVGPVALRGTEDVLLEDQDATDELGSGEPAVWAAGGNRSLTPEQQARARKAWQVFTTWFGRPIGTLQQGAEALGLEPPPPNLTQSESTMAFLLGLRFRPAANEQEAVRRGLQQREYRFKEAEADIRIPER